MKNMITFALSAPAIKKISEFAATKESEILRLNEEMFVVMLDIGSGRGTIQSKDGRSAAFNSRNG